MLSGLHRSGLQSEGCQDGHHPSTNRCDHPSSTPPEGYQGDESTHPDLAMVLYGCASSIKQWRQRILWNPVARCPNAAANDSSECCTWPCCPSHSTIDTTECNLQWHVQQQWLRTSRYFYDDEWFLGRLLTSWNYELDNGV